jgi:adenosylcobinamide-phosphate synthase
MSRALGLLLGYAADRVLGDPQRLHPVAGFGTVAAGVERRLYRDSRTNGIVHTTLLVGGAVIAGTLLPTNTTTTALATWAVLGGRSLEREAAAVHAHLASGDLPAARQRLTHLVGRDTTTLSEGDVARAVVESVAENTSDAVVAPLVWGAIAGVPGLFGYRAANTLDAMVGHHNVRYENFGWASARFDDLVNLPGSRLAGLLATVLGGRPRDATTAWRRDAAAHPSPNAGVVESTFAASLGITLGGTNTYRGRTEHRAVMGRGRAPEPTDIPGANRLAARVGLAAALLCATAASAGRGGRAATVTRPPRGPR